MEFINVADLPDRFDPQGRSYRQVNAAKTHTIPIGSLVELESGIRLFVVHHSRDCDETPLYMMAMKPDESVFESEDKRFRSRMVTGGYGEESLTVIKAGPSE
jgi:hypothetical protein